MIYSIRYTVYRILYTLIVHILCSIWSYLYLGFGTPRLWLGMSERLANGTYNYKNPRFNWNARDGRWVLCTHYFVIKFSFRGLLATVHVGNFKWYFPTMRSRTSIRCRKNSTRFGKRLEQARARIHYFQGWVRNTPFYWLMMANTKIYNSYN